VSGLSYWIKDFLDDGDDADQITNKLTRNGFSQVEIDEAIEFVESMRDGEPSAWEQEQYRSGIR